MLVAIHERNEAGDVVTLQEDLMILWHDKELFIHAGFQSDGCSTPSYLWASISPAIDPRTIRAATAHDFLYRKQPASWSRKEADDLFYDLCREDGLSWWKAQKAYWGIRLFGGISWEKNRRIYGES